MWNIMKMLECGRISLFYSKWAGYEIMYPTLAISIFIQCIMYTKLPKPQQLHKTAKSSDYHTL